MAKNCAGRTSKMRYLATLAFVAVAVSSTLHSSDAQKQRRPAYYPSSSAEETSTRTGSYYDRPRDVQRHNKEPTGSSSARHRSSKSSPKSSKNRTKSAVAVYRPISTAVASRRQGAFFRPSPSQQSTFAKKLSSYVDDDEFDDEDDNTKKSTVGSSKNADWYRGGRYFKFPTTSDRRDRYHNQNNNPSSSVSFFDSNPSSASGVTRFPSPGGYSSISGNKNGNNRGQVLFNTVGDDEDELDDDGPSSSGSSGPGTNKKVVFESNGGSKRPSRRPTSTTSAFFGNNGQVIFGGGTLASSVDADDDEDEEDGGGGSTIKRKPSKGSTLFPFDDDSASGSGTSKWTSRPGSNQGQQQAHESDLFHAILNDPQSSNGHRQQGELIWS